MSVIAAALKHMLASGMPHDAIVAAVADMEAAMPAADTRSAGAIRQQRYRDRNKASQSVTSDENVTVVSPKKETSPTPPKEKTTPSQSEPNGSSKTPRQALETVLDADRAASVVDHRRRIGKPMTVRAAELLAGKFAECPDPNAAADAMVLNGWQGFMPEWMDRQQSRGSPPRTSSSALADSAARLAQSMRSADEIRSGSRSGSIPALVSHLPLR